MSEEPEFQAPEAEEHDKGFPACRYGPDGQSMICNSKADVPEGWVDHPSKVKGAPDPSLDTSEKRRSRPELIKLLRQRGIDFKPNAGAAELDALLAAAEAEDDPFDHDGDGKPGGSKPKARKVK